MGRAGGGKGESSGDTVTRVQTSVVAVAGDRIEGEGETARAHARNRDTSIRHGPAAGGITAGPPAAPQEKSPPQRGKNSRGHAGLPWPQARQLRPSERGQSIHARVGGRGVNHAGVGRGPRHWAAGNPSRCAPGAGGRLPRPFGCGAPRGEKRAAEKPPHLPT